MSLIAFILFYFPMLLLAFLLLCHLYILNVALCIKLRGEVPLQEDSIPQAGPPRRCTPSRISRISRVATFQEALSAFCLLKTPPNMADFIYFIINVALYVSTFKGRYLFRRARYRRPVPLDVVHPLISIVSSHSSNYLFIYMYVMYFLFYSFIIFFSH